MIRTDSAFCPHDHRAVELVGRRWTGALLAGAPRFGEIKAVVPGLSDRLLARRLKELESEGILTLRSLDGRVDVTTLVTS